MLARRDDARSDRQPLNGGIPSRDHTIGFQEYEVTHSVDQAHTVGRQDHRQAGRCETQTASGLFIPDNAKEKPQQGEVLAVGPGRRDDKGERIPMDVKVGDKVLYSKYGGTEVHYEGEDYLIVSSRDVLAILG